MVAGQTLQKKLWRELWHMRGQAIAIALVIVGGVAVCVMSLSTYDSLINTRDNYYRDYQFADIFSSLKRAPNSLAKRVEGISGVAAIETRVVAQVNLEVPGFTDPVVGIITSIPDHGQPVINRLHLISGRLPDSRRDNEVLVSDAFAEAQGLVAGDILVAIINGRRRDMQVVGIALSPEHIYQIAPGAIMPDYERFGVLWMANKPLAIAYDMEGAFNDIVLLLQPGANPESVIDQLDLLLERYGGLGAYDREDQHSNAFLKEELSQLQTMSVIFPVIFLGVAVFLLNVVITRLISTQREIIALLKAFGYSNWQVGLHYSELVLLITGFGITGGYAVGIWLGGLTTVTYTDYFRFPELLYTVKPSILIGVSLLTCLAALIGTIRSVSHAAGLPPAEAMSPASPERYHLSWFERIGLLKILSPPGRMILRHLQRKPLKTMLSVMGLSMASAIMMVGNFQQDSVKLMMHVQFKMAQKEDIQITLYEPVSDQVLSTLRSIPGVQYVEGMRNIPVKLHYQHRSFRTSLQGISSDAQLQQVLNLDLESIVLPETGLMVTDHLANKLGFKAGDIIEIETLEGKRQRHEITVNQLSQQFIGLGSYMRIENVNRLMSEGNAINSALLTIDSSQSTTIYKRLKEMPAIAGINLRQSAIDSFQNMLNQILLVFTFINATLGAVIAFGVVYNTVRIALAERARELASMRVLGYSESEVAYILLGELAVLTAASIPIGFALGNLLCQFMAANLASDLFRIPMVLSAYTYSFSALIVIFSALVSASLVWRRLKQLDLVEVLKTRE